MALGTHNPLPSGRCQILVVQQLAFQLAAESMVRKLVPEWRMTWNRLYYQFKYCFISWVV